MFDTSKLEWTRQPKKYLVEDGYIEITTEPHTDLWQRTYYHFRNDNAPLLQFQIDEPYFSFTVKTHFDSRTRFDQCGIVVYLDAENWLKASVEYADGEHQDLGSVVTNLGYSDWATMPVSSDIRTMWYRLSRRTNDFRIEFSPCGTQFRTMRICHLMKAQAQIPVGIYACSPEDSSFKATFTHMELGDCVWAAHDGQPPDQD